MLALGAISLTVEDGGLNMGGKGKMRQCEVIFMSIIIEDCRYTLLQSYA